MSRVGGKNPINLTKDSAADDTQPAFRLMVIALSFARSEKVKASSPSKRTSG